MKSIDGKGSKARWAQGGEGEGTGETMASLGPAIIISLYSIFSLFLLGLLFGWHETKTLDPYFSEAT